MGNKKITMSDIAKELNLSINAISLALNDRAGVSEKTRRQVLNKAEEMGYLDQRKKYNVVYSNKNICVIIEKRFFEDLQFYGRVLLGIENTAKEGGYDIFVNSFEKDEKKVPACVENKKVSGVIVVGKISDEVLSRLREYRLPVVLVDHISYRESTDCIITDNKAGTFKITKYLITNGFQKIGFFGDIRYSPSVRERFWGYQEALQEYMPFQDFESSMNYVEQYSMLNKVEDYVIGQDMEGLKNSFLLIKERPEVLICSNDKSAILLCKALELLGYQIPQDISIVGFDDIELGKMVVPKITTVHVDKELMGKKGMQRLLYRIEHPNDKVEKIMMDVSIVERESVKIPYKNICS